MGILFILHTALASAEFSVLVSYTYNPKRLFHSTPSFSSFHLKRKSPTSHISITPKTMNIQKEKGSRLTPDVSPLAHPH